MSAALIGALGGMVGAGAFLAFAGLTGRQMLGPRRSVGAASRVVGTLAPARVAAGVVVGGAVLVLTRWPVAGLLAAFAVVAGPRLLGGRRGREASITRTEAIAGWTEMVRDSIAAASGLEEAIQATATVAPPAIRSEVIVLVRRLEHQGLPEALAAFGDDVSHPSADLVVAALSIAARMEASDMTGLLSRLADAIRGEARMRIRVEVGRTRVRTATKVIVGVVAATIGLLTLLNRSYLSAYDSAGGQVVLLVVGAIFAAGGWMLLHMSQLDMPERFSARSSASRRGRA